VGIYETRALRTVNANKMELLTCGTWIRWQKNKVGYMYLPRSTLDLGAWAGHGHKKQDKMGQERTCKSRIDVEPVSLSQCGQDWTNTMLLPPLQGRYHGGVDGWGISRCLCSLKSLHGGAMGVLAQPFAVS
jgi:hypothetical protein